MPWAKRAGLIIKSIEFGSVEICMPFNTENLRPGGTLSGPSMMMLADTAMYAVVLSVLGVVKLAVTTSFNINFLMRPNQSDLYAKGQSLKVGKRLVVIEVSLISAGMEELVAQATGSYSVPPKV